MWSICSFNGFQIVGQINALRFEPRADIAIALLRQHAQFQLAIVIVADFVAWYLHRSIVIRQASFRQQLIVSIPDAHIEIGYIIEQSGHIPLSHELPFVAVMQAGENVDFPTHEKR